jgi:predicted transposase YbfD/YdcC
MDSLKIFDGLPDPRQHHLITYELKSLVFITISAVVSGCDTFTDVALFAKYKRDWITQFAPLPEGKTPSHDIFGDLFSSLCTESFCDHFVSWVSMVSNITSGELIAIDGKRIRGSYDKFDQKAAIHVVSAWAQQNSLVLGQVKVDDKSNEITAIPKILEMLEMKGAIISIDAMGCQKVIAEDIIERQADYILALKGNQSALHQQVKGAFDSIKAYSETEHITKDHGRIETRKCTVVNDLGLIDECSSWVALHSVVKIESTRHQVLSGKTTNEIRYYISSLDANAGRFNELIRGHWVIENSLHWTLDMTFSEDRSRIRKGNADENFSTIRRIAINILKLNKSKGSMKAKRTTAALSDQFREMLLKI